MLSALKSLFETKPPESCLVLGAGVAGLLAARRLSEAGIEVTVADEAPVPGGDLLTEEFEGGVFDVGNQFITAQSWQLCGRLSPLIGEGVLSEWNRTFMSANGVRANDRYPRLRCLGGMASLAKRLADGLDVQTGLPLASISWRGDHWEVRTSDDRELTAGALIVTLPPARGVALIDAGNFELGQDMCERLGNIACDHRLTLMAVLEGPSGVPAPGGAFLDEPLAWIADNRRKGISPGAWAVTVQAGRAFSRAHWESDDDTVAREMIAAAQRWLGSHVQASRIHRQPHGLVRGRDEASFVEVRSHPPLLFAGEGFGAGGFEGAALSGLAAAEHVGTRRLNPLVSLLLP